jgi:hypothetical protein
MVTLAWMRIVAVTVMTVRMFQVLVDHLFTNHVVPRMTDHVFVE